ncbi:MAG: flavin reductase family protein [Chloroflexota bacterium]|nr:flavin reductase family protein [Chloroflexota bacterium]
MSIDEGTFKRAMAQFATGVTIVATMADDKPVGITANAFCSVSLEPFLVLVCVDKQLYTHEKIERSGVYAVSILSLEQMEWADRFAGRYPEMSNLTANRFEGIDYRTATTGAPIIPGCLAWVDCEVRHSYDGGDHTIFVGEVVAGAMEEDEEPLLYFESRWCRLAEEGPEAGSSWPEE